jgi:ATP-dependent DNA helicase RecG
MENILVTQLAGVGPSLQKKLTKLGIRSLQDCLFHLPYRYQDRTHIHPIGTLRPGDQAVVEGNIVDSQITFGKRRMLRVRINDSSGDFYLRFFHFSNNQKDKLVPGLRIRCFGEVRLLGRQLEMIHPEYTIGQLGKMPQVQETMTPIYALTEGITQATLRKVILQALKILEKHEPADLLPEDIISKHQFPNLKQALLFLHQPPPEADLQALLSGKHPAQQRLAFEELAAHHISLLRYRAKQQEQHALCCADLSVANQLEQGLPFALTRAQQNVLAAIKADLQKTVPALRLIQGDVGSGKTIVAAMAMCYAVASGFQAALMAPTEILAEQHYQSFKAWLNPLGVNVVWLTGKLPAKEKQVVYDSIASGEAQIIIGTHALVQDGVQFKKLALAVIDEQHRFGVHQRLKLVQKGKSKQHVPHQLIMTATPIPRTLAMTAYADLDYSAIDELPPGRKPVGTVVIGNERRDEIIQRVAQACRSGKQAYWVCTLIDESEALTAEAAAIIADKLRDALPDINIGLVHGKLKSDAKENVMQAYVNNDIQLLVATTVIEVGVNVPNATLMIIENPERLGLAQLHQLRGRVGRGAEQSHCVLLYHAPLSFTAKQRLSVMRDTADGFLIAEKDLEIRGPGEWLGTLQSGEMRMQIADIVRDRALLPQVRPCAESIMHTYKDKADALVTRWIGTRTEFAKA